MLLYQTLQRIDSSSQKPPIVMYYPPPRERFNNYIGTIPLEIVNILMGVAVYIGLEFFEEANYSSRF